jgi:hypothetical protein
MNRSASLGIFLALVSACASGGKNGGGAGQDGAAGRGGAAGGAAGSAGGGAAGAAGGGGAAAGAGGGPNVDAASDASDPLACPQTMPSEHSACVAYCSITDAGIAFLYPPTCTYGNERCYCTSGTSGGCACQPGQGLCPMAIPPWWTCNPVGG